MMGPGIFGDMFDFNKDGKLDFIEQAAEFAFLDELASQEKKGSEDMCDSERDNAPDCIDTADASAFADDVRDFINDLLALDDIDDEEQEEEDS